MRLPLVQFAILATLLAGCGSESAIKPAEHLDERTGVTVGTLEEPVEFVEAAKNAPLGNDRHTSFAYLGPVEWDNAGELTYGLWLHIAPGNDRQVGDIRSPEAVTLILDDGQLVLSPMDSPYPGSKSYRPVVSWGQTSFFVFDVAMLSHIANSGKLNLSFHGTDHADVDFMPTHETRETLKKFMRSRGITDD